MNATVSALVRRGLSTSHAESLHARGITLAKLRHFSPKQLTREGISPAAQEAIRNGKRPPVPEETALQLLYANKNVCCVCQSAIHGVIIHHIVAWSDSHNHDESNLVILCPGCHDRAHTRRDLTRNLTPEQLRHHKEQWQTEVRNARTRVLFTKQPYSLSDGVWDVFNRQRLLDCANTQHIDVTSLPGANHIRDTDSEHNDKHYRWQGRLRIGEDNEYSFYAHLLRRIADEQDWVDLRRIWTKSQFDALLKPNTLFALTTNFRFRTPRRKADRGPGQTRMAYYQKRRLRVEFSFDAWECTTNSAHTCNLLGNWICTALGFVRSLEDVHGVYTIKSTCLAIGTGFSDYVGDTPDIALMEEAQGEAEADDS